LAWKIVDVIQTIFMTVYGKGDIGVTFRDGTEIRIGQALAQGFGFALFYLL